LVALVILAELSTEDPVDGDRTSATRQLGAQRRNHRPDLGRAIALDGRAGCAPVSCVPLRLRPSAPSVRLIS
jgi:hypothetical protein